MKGPPSLLLATGLALAGCSRPQGPGASAPGSPPPTEAGDPAAEPTPSEPRYVMLHAGATLASGLDETADTAQAYDRDRDHASVRRVWIMRPVDTYGDWIAVETLESKHLQAHCEAPMTSLDAFALRLHVPLADVLTVTTREVEITVPGGNRVTVGSGVRVTPPEGEQAPAVVHLGHDLPLAVPADALGREYPTPRAYDEDEAIATLRPGPLWLTERIELPDTLGWRVLARRDEGDDAIVTLAEPCARFELRVPSSRVGEPQQFGYGTLGTSSSSRLRYRIAAEAPIYWRNGERAGSTRHEVLRYDEPSRREVGRVCFDHPLTWNSQTADPALTLCFDAVDVKPADSAVDHAEPAAPG